MALALVLLQLLILLVAILGAVAQQPICPQTNCCRMTEAELDACRGIEPKCPGSDYTGLKSIEDASCAECPPGQCRFGTQCVCPQSFIKVTGWHKSCKVRFQNKWPQSAGEEEIDRRHCGDTSDDPICKTGACCSLSEEELQNCRGANSKCPALRYADSDWKVTDESCDECPVGMCRYSGYCVCPARYLEVEGWHKGCAKRFNFNWPQSVGQEEVDRRHCNGKVNILGGKGQSTTSKSGSSTEQSDKNAEEESDSTEDKLSTLEIVGILVGIASGLISMGSGALWCYKRRK